MSDKVWVRYSGYNGMYSVMFSDELLWQTKDRRDAYLFAGQLIVNKSVVDNP